MKITEKGQVTIPKPLRDRLGIVPGEVLEFAEEEGRLVARKMAKRDAFDELYGTLDLGMSTDRADRYSSGGGASRPMVRRSRLAAYIMGPFLYAATVSLIEPSCSMARSDSSSTAAARFSRRCARDDVPGISRILGERCSNHASARMLRGNDSNGTSTRRRASAPQIGVRMAVSGR